MSGDIQIGGDLLTVPTLERGADPELGPPWLSRRSAQVFEGLPAGQR